MKTTTENNQELIPDDSQGQDSFYKVPMIKSLYWRLGFAFFVIIMLTGIAQIYITAYSFRPFLGHYEQLVSRDLAAKFAEHIQPMLLDGLDKEQVESKLIELVLLNPKIEAYILDAKGRILAEASPHGMERKVDRVPLEPIFEFLDSSSSLIPIYGRDPTMDKLSANGPNRAISVASIKIAQNDGYLYLVLEASVFRIMARGLGQFYILAFSLIGLVLVLLVATVIGYILFSYLTRNLRELSKVVLEFQSGNMKARAVQGSTDEIGSLARAVNQMADTIEVQTESLKQNDKLRRELIANISHDLRSPLTSIQGFVETLQIKGEQLEDSERNRYLGMVMDSIRLQSQLLEDLFELSKLEARERKPQLETVHIGELVRDIATRNETIAQAKGLLVETQIDEDCPLLDIDPVMIDRVVSNLLSNAIRYTPKDGVIKVCVANVEDSCEVRVSDTGVGIPNEEIPYIFDSFYRVHKDRDKRSGGTGLGLAIVKKILELHESDIRVSSCEGEGTEFRFCLRVQKSNI